MPDAFDQTIISPVFTEERTQTAPLPHWGREAIYRLGQQWWLKTIGITAFMFAFFSAYIYLLRHAFFPVTLMPLTTIDRLVPFQPDWLPVYASLWVYVSLPPGLLKTRRELYYYGAVVGSLCLAGLGIFLLWPTAIPTAEIDWGQFPGFATLKGIDAAGNACPSLHVATAVFSAFWLQRLISEIRAPQQLNYVNWLWCIAIAYSTLATKQHVMLDVMGGTVLGLLAAFMSLRFTRR